MNSHDKVRTNGDHGSRIKWRQARDRGREWADVLSQGKPVKSIHSDSEVNTHMKTLGRGISAAIGSNQDRWVNVVKIVGEYGIVDERPWDTSGLGD